MHLVQSAGPCSIGAEKLELWNSGEKITNSTNFCASGKLAETELPKKSVPSTEPLSEFAPESVNGNEVATRDTNSPQSEPDELEECPIVANPNGWSIPTPISRGMLAFIKKQAKKPFLKKDNIDIDLLTKFKLALPCPKCSGTIHGHVKHSAVQFRGSKSDMNCNTTPPQLALARFGKYCPFLPGKIDTWLSKPLELAE